MTFLYHLQWLTVFDIKCSRWNFLSFSTGWNIFSRTQRLLFNLFVCLAKMEQPWGRDIMTAALLPYQRSLTLFFLCFFAVFILVKVFQGTAISRWDYFCPGHRGLMTAAALSPSNDREAKKPSPCLAQASVSTRLSAREAILGLTVLCCARGTKH